MATANDSVKRTLFIVYGVFCYVAFLAVSAYAFAFVGNYWAVLGWKGPWFRSLDGGSDASLAEAIVIDLLLMALFGVQHSVMARRSFKDVWTRVVPRELERSTYVLLASFCLALLCWQWRPVGWALWNLSSTSPGLVLVVVSLAGWTIVVHATFLIDHPELFGLRQAFGAFQDRSKAVTEFKTRGLYRAVRHPLYFGFLVAFWAAPVMSLGHLVFASGLTLYVLVAIPLEERDLVAQFGDRYRDYRKRVRALLPFPKSE